MSAARVDAVISTVERHDASLASWMQVAADGLTAGEGEELITQAGLQWYLWASGCTPPARPVRLYAMYRW